MKREIQQIFSPPTTTCSVGIVSRGGTVTGPCSDFGRVRSGHVTVRQTHDRAYRTFGWRVNVLVRSDRSRVKTARGPSFNYTGSQ